METWKEINGFNGRYLISNLGNVKSIDWPNTLGRVIKGKMLKTQMEGNGYLQVGLITGQKQIRYLVHRIVAHAFIPKIDGKTFVNHKNGIKTDNRVENLEWVTRSENIKHAFKIGLQCNKGENHPSNKLKELQVIEIRSKHSQGVSAYKLSKEYGISYTQAKDIVKKRSWRHI